MRNCLFVALTAILSFHVHAADFSCPEGIETQQSLTTPVEKAWKVSLSTSKNLFDGIEVFDGHPDEMASLVPDMTEPKNPSWSAPVKGFWMVCKYRETKVRLVQSITAKFKKCKVSSKSTILNCN